MPEFFVHPDIAKAKTIDTNYYLSKAYYEDSKEKIFAPLWQFIGDKDKVKDAGSAYPFTLLENYLNEPLLLTRDKNGDLHCMSNVCTHRGNLVVYEPCKLNQLRCKYHGRLFALDGKFISMPEFKEVENFPTKDDDLHELALFTWGQLLFTNLGSRYQPSDFFGEMMQRINWFPLN